MATSKHVCIITTVHHPFDVRIFHKQARSLRKAGYEVSLIAPYEREERIRGIHLCPLGQPRSRAHRMTVLLIRALRMALRKKADVYHIHDPELIPWGLVLKAFTSAKVVYDIHEDYPHQILSKEWLPTGLRTPVAKSIAILEYLAARFFDGLVAATPEIAARFPKRKTIIAQNFPLVEEFYLPLGEEVPYQQRPMQIIYVGGITVIRGAMEMVHAMEYLSMHLEAKLVLVGKFSPPSLESDLRQLPGWKHVNFLGWQDRKSVFSILTNSRVGIVVFHPAPNHIASQPNKLFEYMAAGIPVVASNFPRWREIVEGEGCGLTVDPLNPKAIAEAIRWLLEHPEQAEEMGRRGRQAVLKKYNWGREEKKLLTLYRRLL